MLLASFGPGSQAAPEPGLPCSALDTHSGWFTPARRPSPLPEEPFKDALENDIHLQSLRGRPLLVHFWGTWCPPCVKELPAIDRLQRLLWDDGLLVVPVSRDRGGANKVREMYEKLEIRNLPVFTDRWGKFAHAHGVGKVPVTLYVDREGRELGRLTGTVAWDSPELIGHIRDCMDIGPAAP